MPKRLGYFGAPRNDVAARIEAEVRQMYSRDEGTWEGAREAFLQDMEKIPYPHERPSWAETFKGMLDVLANRSTCNRLQTASVVVDADKRILGMGYNGAPKYMPHCIEVGCLMEKGHCVRAIHDTANALMRVNPTEAKGAIIYQLYRPCIRCVQMMINYQIRHLTFWSQYETDDTSIAIKLANAGGITVSCLGDETGLAYGARNIPKE